MTARKSPDAIGSRYQNNIDKIKLIKSEMVRVHDEIKAQGIYPTLRKILRAMPFWVHEQLGTELRHELVEEGLIPKPPRGSTNAAKLAEQRIFFHASEKEIKVRKQQIKEESIARMKDEKDYQVSLDHMTPQQASEWARKRYKAAWGSVQAISRHTRRWAFLAHPETVEEAG